MTYPSSAQLQEEEIHHTTDRTASMRTYRFSLDYDDGDSYFSDLSDWLGRQVPVEKPPAMHRREEK